MSLNIIVTSSSTREFFDPIRYLSNPATGKMGYYIARAAINHGHKVTFISGPANPEYSNVDEAKNISIISTDDMMKAVLKELKDGFVLIMAAAPADFKPETTVNKKIKKTETSSLTLVPNPDILLTVAEYAIKKKWKKLFVVGFAAETHDIENYALKKLKDKNLDIIFLNDLTKRDSGFGKDTNQLTVFRKNGERSKWKTDSKEKLGYKIICEIEKLYDGKI